MAKEQTVLKIRVQQDTFSLDFDALTWGELEELETLMGCALEDANFATARGVLAMAFIAMRRERPAITLDALKALPMSEIELVEDDAVPTSAVEDGEDENSGNPA